MKPLTTCRYLGNKAFSFPPPLEGYADEADNEGLTTPCWCDKTQHALGPDGDPVDLDCCAKGRPCFVPEVDL